MGLGKTAVLERVNWMCFVEIGSKLDSAEQRCNVLERQLEYMRRMVHSAESDRSEVLRKTAHLSGDVFI